MLSSTQDPNNSNPAAAGNLWGNGDDPTPANVGVETPNARGDPNQGRAGRNYRYLQINDPFNQAHGSYNLFSTNQPLASHIAFALEHQYRLADSQMSRYVLSPIHERFLLDHLHYHDPAYYISTYVSSRSTWGTELKQGL